MLTLAEFWGYFGVRDVIAIILAWIISFGMLAVTYARTTRWDRVWKARWELRHGSSLEKLRSGKQRMLRVLTLGRWVMLAMCLMSIGTGVGPMLSVVKELQREPALIIVLYVVFIVLTLLGLLLTVASLKLIRYQLARIDRLMADS